MRIATGITGVTSWSGQAEKPIFALGITGTGYTAANDAAALAHLDGIEATISYVDGSDNLICRAVSLQALAEFSAGTEGIFSYDTTDFHLTVLISAGGVLSIAPGAYFDIRLDGLDAGGTYDIYGLETFIMSPYMMKYSKMDIPSGVEEKQFDLRNFDAVMAKGHDELQFTATNGLNPRRTAAEDTFFNQLQNDIAAVNGTSVDYNAIDYTIINIEAVEHVVVTASAASQLIGVGSVLVGDENVATNKNQSLYSTTV